MAIRGGTGTISGGRVGGNVGGGRIGGSVGNGPKGIGSEGVRISLGGERGIADAVPASMTKSSFGEALRAAATTKGPKSESKTYNPFQNVDYGNAPVNNGAINVRNTENSPFGPVVRRGSVAAPRAEARPAKPLNVRTLSEWNSTRAPEPKVVVKFGSLDKANATRKRDAAPRVVRKDLPNTIGVTPDIQVRPRTEPVIGIERPRSVEPVVQPAVLKPEVKPQVAAEQAAKAVSLIKVRKALANEPPTRPLPTWTEQGGLPERVISEQRANGKPETRLQRLLGSDLALRYGRLLRDKEALKAADDKEAKKKAKGNNGRTEWRQAIGALGTSVARRVQALRTTAGVTPDVQAEPLRIRKEAAAVQSQLRERTALITRRVEAIPELIKVTAPLERQIAQAQTVAQAAAAPEAPAQAPNQNKAPDKNEPKPVRPRGPLQISADERAIIERRRDARSIILRLLAKIRYGRRNTQDEVKVSGYDLASRMSAPNPRNTSSIVKPGQDGSYDLLRRKYQSLGADSPSEIAARAYASIEESRPVQKGYGLIVRPEEIDTVVNRRKIDFELAG